MTKRLTSAQLSARPGYPSEWTLSRWRMENVGPPFIQIGARYFYDLDEVEQWEQSNRAGGRPLTRKKPGPKPKATIDQNIEGNAGQ